MEAERNTGMLSEDHIVELEAQAEPALGWLIVSTEREVCTAPNRLSIGGGRVSS